MPPGFSGLVLNVLKVGTRGSALALVQTEGAAAALLKIFPDLLIETVRIKTTGDKILDAPLSKIGAKSLFTKEIEEALLDGKIDLAVHSLKDLPTEVPSGLEIGAVLEREDPRDCLVANKRMSLEDLPKGAKVGTSSLRRAAQILALRPDIRVENLRGNLDTRLKKIEEGAFDAIVVAQAGLTRLNAKVTASPIPFEEMLPAVGQGFVAIEIRSDDARTKKIVEPLNDGQAQIAALCERAFLRTLEGGCQVPIGALAIVEGPQIRLEGLISSLDGKIRYRDKIAGAAKDCEQVGINLAKKLLSKGGDKILESIRS